MPALLAVAGGAPVIEDAAHAPLSYLNGRMAGSFGVAGFYSFASTKYWPAGGGGLAVVHRHESGRANLPIAIRFACPAFASRGIARPGSSGRKSDRLPSAAVRILRAAIAALDRQVGAARALSGSARRSSVRGPRWPAARHCGFRRASNCSGPTACRLLARLGTVDDVVLPRERPGAQYNYHLFPVCCATARSVRR